MTFYFATPYHSGARQQRERHGLTPTVPAEGEEHGRLSQPQCKPSRRSSTADRASASLQDAAGMLRRVLVSVALKLDVRRGFAT